MRNFLVIMVLLHLVTSCQGTQHSRTVSLHPVEDIISPTPHPVRNTSTGIPEALTFLSPPIGELVYFGAAVIGIAGGVGYLPSVMRVPTANTIIGTLQDCRFSTIDFSTERDLFTLHVPLLASRLGQLEGGTFGMVVIPICVVMIALFLLGLVHKQATSKTNFGKKRSVVPPKYRIIAGSIFGVVFCFFSVIGVKRGAMFASHATTAATGMVWGFTAIGLLFSIIAFLSLIIYRRISRAVAKVFPRTSTVEDDVDDERERKFEDASENSQPVVTKLQLGTTEGKLPKENLCLNNAEPLIGIAFDLRPFFQNAKTFRCPEYYLYQFVEIVALLSINLAGSLKQSETPHCPFTAVVMFTISFANSIFAFYFAPIHHRWLCILYQSNTVATAAMCLVVLWGSVRQEEAGFLAPASSVLYLLFVVVSSAMWGGMGGLVMYWSQFRPSHHCTDAEELIACHRERLIVVEKEEEEEKRESEPRQDEDVEMDEGVDEQQHNTNTFDQPLLLEPNRKTKRVRRRVRVLRSSLDPTTRRGYLQQQLEGVLNPPQPQIVPADEEPQRYEQL